MKNIFDTIKERLRSHESSLDLDREWAALNNRRAQKHQQSSRRRMAIVLLLLLFIGSCGSLIWLKMRHHPAIPTPAPTVSDLAQANPTSPIVTKGIAGTKSPAPSDTMALLNAPNGVRINTTKTETPILNDIFASEKLKKAPLAHKNTPNTNQVTTAPLAVAPIDAAPNTATTTVPMADTALVTTTTSVNSAAPIANGNVSSLSARGIAVPVMASSTVLPTMPVPYSPLAQEPTAAKQPSPKTMVVFVGGGWLSSQQHFRAADSQLEQYAALRQETETALPSFTFNAGVQRPLLKKGFVTASVHYNQWYQRLNYNFEKPQNYTYSNVLLKVSRIDGFGSEVRTYGDTVLAGTQTVRIVHYNRFTSLNLRLTLGRQLVQAGRFVFSAGAGVDGSVWRDAKGVVAAQDPSVGTLNLSEVYKTSFGVGISAITRFEYWFHSHNALHLAPSAVWWMGNALHANGQLGAQWRQFSITAGLKHRF